jgi:response regulator NasT
MSETIRVMLVDDSRGRSAMLEQALQDAGYTVVARVDASERLDDKVKQIQPDVIIIDMEAPGRDTLEHMRSISQEQPKPIVMFTEAKGASEIDKAIKAGVSAYIVDGLDPGRIKPIVDVAVARFREFNALRRELHDTKTKLSERKLVDRAKGLLMRKRNMSEDEAYKTLRKMAMDKNITVADVAQNIIDLSDLLG